MSAHLDRFMRSFRLEPQLGCWVWTGRLLKASKRAYFQADNRRHIAARWLWQAMNGPLGKGQCVLHRCDNPSCVNPDHLFIGTQRDNIDDCLAKGRTKLAKKFCKNGHELTASNVRNHGPGGRWRHCRACARQSTRRYKQRPTRIEAANH